MKIGMLNWCLSVCSHQPFCKVLVKFFQKLAGHGAEPHTGHFSFVSFSLCACGGKEKSGQKACANKATNQNSNAKLGFIGVNAQYVIGFLVQRELTPKAAEGLFCIHILLFTIPPPLRGPPPFTQGRHIARRAPRQTPRQIKI